jgi:hypothetical protein
VLGAVHRRLPAIPFEHASVYTKWRGCGRTRRPRPGPDDTSSRPMRGPGRRSRSAHPIRSTASTRADAHVPRRAVALASPRLNLA